MKYFPIFGLLNSKGDPMILGFAGAARSGKDTVGAYFVKEYMFKHCSFAKPLKEACKVMFGLSDEQIANKETIIEPWGLSPRQMYQKVGIEMRRTIDPNIWLKNVEIEVNKCPGFSFVITDVRFSNEALWIHNRGGKVIKVVRNQELIKDSHHITERGLTPEEIDYTLINNGTINDLHNAIEDIVFEEHEIAVQS